MEAVRILYRELRKLKWKREVLPAFNRYCETADLPKLQIGGGPNVLAGWFNTDLFPWRSRSGGLFHLDATRPFPFPSESFHRVFSEHVIEHLERPHALAMLKECRRVLVPRGRIRISCPDLETLARLYQQPSQPEQHSYMREVIGLFQSGEPVRPGYVINQLFDLGHRFLYDKDTLRDALERAGFTAITQHRAGVSADPLFDGIDAHGSDYVAFETLVLEAEKPL